MSTDTLMWLLPVVFMIHDFEEIIFFKSWGKKHQATLQQRFPAAIRRVLENTLSLSTPAFAFAVACLFATISLATFLCIQYQWITLWTGMLLVFFIHLVIHILSSIALRSIVPALITSVLATGYSIFALARIWSHPQLNTDGIWSAIILCLAILGLVFWGSIRAAKALDRYL